MRQFYIYILTNRPKGVLYIGVTGNLEGRVVYHREILTKTVLQVSTVYIV